MHYCGIMALKSKESDKILVLPKHKIYGGMKMNTLVKIERIVDNPIIENIYEISMYIGCMIGERKFRKLDLCSREKGDIIVRWANEFEKEKDEIILSNKNFAGDNIGYYEAIDLFVERKVKEYGWVEDLD